MTDMHRWYFCTLVHVGLKFYVTSRSSFCYLVCFLLPVPATAIRVPIRMCYQLPGVPVSLCSVFLVVILVLDTCKVPCSMVCVVHALASIDCWLLETGTNQPPSLSTSFREYVLCIAILVVVPLEAITEPCG